MKEFFPEIKNIKYEGPKSKEPLSFKYYNPEEKIMGKTMREQLKFAMAYWHTLCADGTDMFGIGTMDKSFGGSSSMEISKNKVYAGFELMNKLGVDYFCFHDRDLVSEGETLADFHRDLEVIVGIVEEQMKEHGKKLLWATANMFSHPRYAHGAGTSCDPDVFAYAAAQIKQAIDIDIRLGGSGYVFWGGREGYETLLNTDMGFELDNMAYLLTMARDYGRAHGFKGDFYIEPKPKEPTKHQYDFDAATVIGFLRKYGLDGDFKLNIEANHATLAAHTFQHELRTAAINNMFGSVDANQGDCLLGWDTDQFPTNIYETTLAMYEIIKCGGFTNGGLNFDAKLRRASARPEDIFYGFISGMDSFALGLRLAAKIIEDGRLDEFVKSRYAGFETGIGADIKNRRTSLEALSDYAFSLGRVGLSSSGRQEYLESLINSVMFG
ncbi:MAG: xylose isomerase [Firmicutes bacterium]|nr:xylose isomerase [Bacillota bacterium]